MKPKRLKIKGLNSFIEEQDIYFDQLVERGLFGIFGPTGSGKSTILDAITLSLYGSIARGSNEYINSFSEDMYVYYEFQVLNEGERKTYSVERIIKREKKDRNKYKTSSSRLVYIKDDEREIVAEGVRSVEESIKSIIGLTLDDFTRSVVLPQGKFSEFLKLTGRERRDMLERIFLLESYGKNLSEKIKKVRVKTYTKLQQLEGQLKSFEGISKERYHYLKEKMDLLHVEEKRLSLDKSAAENHYEKYKKIWELQKELNGYLEKLQIVKEKEKEINLKKYKWDRGIRASKVKPFLESVIDTEEKLEKNKVNIEGLSTQLNLKEVMLRKLEDKYNYALDEKNCKLPILIKKESDLLIAKDRREKLNIIIKDRDALQIEWKKRGAEKSLNEDELKKTNKDTELIKLNIESLEKDISSLKVQGEFKENVQEGALKERELKELSKRFQDVKDKLNLKKDELKKLTKHYDVSKKKEEELFQALRLFQKEMQELENLNPGDESALLSLKEKRYLKNQKLEETLKQQGKKCELEGRLKPFIEQRALLESKLEKLMASLNIKENELKKNKNDIEKYKKKNMASILAEEIEEGEACPVCGSIHHPSLAGSTSLDKLEYLANTEEELKEIVSLLQNDKIKLEGELFQVKLNEDNINEQLRECISNLKDIKIEEIQQELNKLNDEAQGLDKSIKEYKTKKEIIENKINGLKEEKLTSEKSIITLEEKINSSKLSIDEINSEIIGLQEKHIKLKEQWSNIIKELNVESLIKELEHINKKDKERESKEVLLKEERNKLENFQAKRTELEVKLNEIKNAMGVITQSGVEKTNFIKAEETEINRFSEGRNIEEYIKEVKSKIELINKAEKELRKSLEKEKTEKQFIQERKWGEEQLGESLNGSLKSYQLKLNESLIENEFVTIGDARDSLVEVKEMERLKNAVESFEEEFKNTINNIERVNERLNGESIEEEKWLQIIQNKEEKSKLLTSKIKEIAALEKELQDMEKALKSVDDLLEVQKKIKHKLSIIQDIEKLVEGNKFVEFAATHHLKYIALESSKRLKEITGDRYALQLDPNSNFVIRDDNNGGSIRSTATLSGGETFVTSLALALALSSQIQLKGSTPLEFFFLDEGFGTLDNTLLEVVMTSLERLRSSRLSVGIISHVEELKNRVPVKLIVEPPVSGTGGSKVRIEYS
ncbi:exonuclease SbcC [Clostridium pascui]|uniref:AAA family ATPase n=1 Tax=Clostridium pascui TaxID=46609 RepID=UPI00195685E7|nr:AAA family ATPase [Clostridium pascui]MBM7870854.1 exonuclease SbcC [Clostridium pascui]